MTLGESAARRGRRDRILMRSEHVLEGGELLTATS